ncbi:MAG: dethiobiotin synthase [Pseudomonadota bacterium]
MPQMIFVSGTDTEIGKTVVCAWLKLHTAAKYWKPVQCGLEPCTDLETVQQLTQCMREDIIPTKYTLKAPLSPHEAAKRENVHIELDAFQRPATEENVIIEGAGGLLVPLNETSYIIDLIKHLECPVILVCRSTLGTLNHTLMSLEAIRARHIDLAGLIMVGPKMPHNREALSYYGQVPVLAELPMLDTLDTQNLMTLKPTREIYDLFH